MFPKYCVWNKCITFVTLEVVHPFGDSRSRLGHLRSSGWTVRIAVRRWRSPQWHRCFQDAVRRGARRVRGVLRVQDRVRAARLRIKDTIRSRTALHVSFRRSCLRVKAIIWVWTRRWAPWPGPRQAPSPEKKLGLVSREKNTLECFHHYDVSLLPK